MSQGSAIVPVQLERAQEEAALLEYAMRTSRGAVYLHCTGAVHNVLKTRSSFFATVGRCWQGQQAGFGPAQQQAAEDRQAPADT